MPVAELNRKLSNVLTESELKTEDLMEKGKGMRVDCFVCPRGWRPTSFDDNDD